jgi:hypothetical protein
LCHHSSPFQDEELTHIVIPERLGEVIIELYENVRIKFRKKKKVFDQFDNSNPNFKSYSQKEDIYWETGHTVILLAMGLTFGL